MRRGEIKESLIYPGVCVPSFTYDPCLPPREEEEKKETITCNQTLHTDCFYYYYSTQSYFSTINQLTET